MKLDLSCPIEIRGYTLNHTNAKTDAALRLYNLSAHRTTSIEAVAKWHSRASGRTIASPVCIGSLRAPGKSIFEINLSTEHLSDADSLELAFTRISFGDGEPDWRAGEGPFAELEPLPAIPTEELSMLRAVAGSDAVCYPAQTSQTWRCVCGRLNANTHDHCARCHRDHFSAIGHTPDSVRFHYDHLCAEQKPASISDAELAAFNRRYLRRRTQLLRRTALAAVAMLALTAFLVLRTAPAHTAAQVVLPAAETMTLDQ